MVFGFDRLKGPSPEMQKKLHDAEMDRGSHVGMEEHDMTNERHEGSWSAMRPEEVPNDEKVILPAEERVIDMRADEEEEDEASDQMAAK